jgi:hypothetical protein
MPAVIDTPERIDIGDITTHDRTYDLPIERPLARPARPGVWRRLAHRLTTSLRPTPRERHAPVCPVSRPFEAPMDRFLRAYPAVALYAHAII